MASEDKKKTEERTPFKIELQELVQFPAIATTAYLTSNEFSKLIAEVFKSVFADFEGCLFEIPQGGEPTISLLFNHGEYGEDAIVACERLGGKESGSVIIDRMRNRDRQMTDGDRYYLTDDAKDVIKGLLTSRIYNNGNINWKNVVGEWVDRTSANMYNPRAAVQYTKVSNLDIRRLAALIFGDKDADGNEIAYDFQVSGMVNPMQYNGMQMSSNYMLTITSVSAAELNNVYQKLGFNSMGVNIIRG